MVAANAGERRFSVAPSPLEMLGKT